MEMEKRRSGGVSGLNLPAEMFSVRTVKIVSFPGKTREKVASPKEGLLMDTDAHLSVPALAAYLRRVGAEELNFRRFMIKQHKGNYYTERCLIKIGADGAIECSSEEYAPTDDERAEIEKGLKAVDFPKSIDANDAQLGLLATGKRETSRYVFRSRQGGGIRMVQIRVETDDGSKAYIPWTYWSDGRWRAMEPEGALPFWKPDAERSQRIMIHEGAKAAATVDALVNDPDRAEELAAHPWGRELADYEHWGMIGGALAPHRADYAELHAIKPVEVVYVADNDWPGKSALREVSRCYARSMRGISFDGRWPTAFDLADPFPKTPAFRAANGKYVGPTMRGSLFPATFATETLQNGKGRPSVIARREFLEEWAHCVRPEVYVHRDWPNKLWSADEFNATVRPVSDVAETSKLVKQDIVGLAEILRYDPSKTEGIYNGGDWRFLNTHAPSLIKPLRGDMKIWNDYLEHLIPVDTDRHELIKWVATLIAKPEVKMLYGVLLVSEAQGVGKTTIAEKVLAPLLGHENVSYPSETEIVESQFNYWCAHKRLAVVNEIYSGHSAKAYNKLKSVITDKYINVSQKYQPNYQVENWVHVYACSNSMRAIQIASDDRRWLVPKVTERKQPEAYWEALNRWLEDDDGLAKIKQWAIDWVAENGYVLRGAAAPNTVAKQEMIEEGMSRGMIEVLGLLEQLRDRANDSGEDVTIMDTQLVDFIRAVVYEGRMSDRLERPLTLRKLAKSKGWFVGEGRVYFGPGRQGRLISTDPTIARTHSSILIENGIKLMELNDFMGPSM